MWIGVKFNQLMVFGRLDQQIGDMKLQRNRLGRKMKFLIRNLVQ